MQTIVENNYRPTERASEFHASDDRIIILRGGMGSGKSRALIQEVYQSCLQWPGMPVAVYRKTMPALRDSTMHEYRQIMPEEVGEWKSKIDRFEFINGSFVNFRGLDDPQKAKSTEYAMIVMEEADEFTLEDFRFLFQRVRKKGPWPLRTVLILNPCDEDHWIYQEFVKNKEVYEKAGGLKDIRFSTYDNIEHLPEGYIEQISAGLTEDEIRRYIMGEWGSIIKGRPVYADILNPDIHLRKVDPSECVMLLRGWDFGYNHPACSFRLVDAMGRQNAAFSMMGDKEDLDVFAPKVIAQTKAKYPGMTIKDFGDPRGHDKGPSAKQTCFEILADFGIYATGERRTREYVDEGIRKTRKKFSTLIGGIPELTVDPTNTLLRVAYFNRYVRGKDGKPVKDGFYEHICDADRYIDHHEYSNSAVKDAIARQKEKRSLIPPRNPYTGY